MKAKQQVRKVRQIVRRQFADQIRPRPWWCPTFVYALAARLILRSIR